ncbi:MAG: alkylated DNA repair dioxygenase AlkB [Pseudoalteromonas distincta]|jgi:alkylated DNA repair dioxygenase AlkB
MHLFAYPANPSKNYLPQDGTVYYHGSIIPEQEAIRYYTILLRTIDWKNDESVIFGKRIITKRKVAWYGSKPFEYTYSKVTKKALLWTPELLEIKKLAELHSGETYNSCLLNLYHDGSEGMSWHSDGEKDLKKNGAIASMSFGAERKFALKHIETKKIVNIYLENGSLLVMKGITQSHWLHRLPPTTKVLTPRINLTFRTISM